MGKILNLEKQDTQKIYYLTFIFFLIIGSYWFLGLIKDTVFFKIAFAPEYGWSTGYGRQMHPIAKFWSPIFTLALLLIYSKLVDILRKDQLFYILCIFFFIAFAFMGIVIGLKVHSADSIISNKFLAAIGWIGFFITDAYGSMMVVLFWSFAVSLINEQSAKTGFPFIIAWAQIGSISGSLLTILVKQVQEIWPLYFIGCLLILLIFLSIKKFSRKFKIPEQKEESTGIAGFFNGITLLLKSPYLIAIFVISTFYEVSISILDYQMKCCQDLSNYFTGQVGFSIFSAIYGVAVNSCTLIVALFGSTLLLKKIGVKKSLYIFPIFLAAAIIGIMFISLSDFNADKILWITLAILVISKSFVYGLNNPARNILYIPTSIDAKFKTKGFTETFGNRAMLMSGALIIDKFKDNVLRLLTYGSLLSLGFIGIWIMAVIYINRSRFNIDSRT